MQATSQTSRHRDEGRSSGDPQQPRDSGRTCRVCLKSFARAENLARHVRTAHTHSAQYQCSRCPKRFKRSDLLRKHQRVHGPVITVSPDAQFYTNSQYHAVEAGTDLSPQGSLTAQPSTGSNVQRTTAEPFGLDDACLAQGDGGTHPESSFNPGLFPADMSSFGSVTVYGEGLFDVDLTWTFDYLDTGLVNNFTEASGADNSMDLQRDTDHTRNTTTASSVIYNGESPTTHSPSQSSSFFRYAGFVDSDEIEHGRRAHTSTTFKRLLLTPEGLQRLFLLVTAECLQAFCGPHPSMNEFPNVQSLQHFLLLFFIHVHPRFPIVHLPTLSIQKCTPELLFAMILAGSCHSRSNGGKFCHTYVERARMVITLNREKDSDYLRDTDHLLTLFILTLTATWCGHNEAYRRAECDRGVLISACRRSRLLDCRTGIRHDLISTPSHGQEKLLHAWSRWIEVERSKRLGLSIYILDCQFAALLQRQPYISKAETTNAAMPSASIYWEAPTAQGWKSLLGPADMPPSIYHLPTLSSILLAKECTDPTYFPPIDAFSRLLYIYIINTHVFEFRQIVCMLNSTGLRDTPVSFAPQQLGSGLLDRQRWLVNALDTWAETYGLKPDSSSTDAQDIAASILYHLGHLALNINFSDLHVVAGRSGSSGDISVATESLRNRLRADTTHQIWKHASRMLEIALAVVRDGQVSLCSFEVAICLFIGGLVNWALCHTFQQEELNMYLATSHEHGSSNAGDEPQNNAMNNHHQQVAMKHKINDLIVALRSISCLGFAAIFASVLDKLQQELR